MKKLLCAGLSLALVFLFGHAGFSQTLDAQNTYTITGKAKRGALGNATYDAAQGIYSLTYVTKANEKKAKFQTYTFDNDFNFLTMTEDEIEFEKAKTKY